MSNTAPSFMDQLTGYLTGDNFSGARNLAAALGNVALTRQAAKRIEGLGDTASSTIQNFQDQLQTDLSFTPYSFTSGIGKVSVGDDGQLQYGLSSPFSNLQNNLAASAQYGMDEVFGRTVDPDTGEVSFDPMRDRQGLMNLLSGVQNASGAQINADGFLGALQGQYADSTNLTDPFTSSDIAAREKTVFDRLNELQAPQQQRARENLQDQLLSQGRLGLQTSQYGGSPEQLALEKAIQEQQAQNAVSAMGVARDEANALSNARLAALGQARADAGLQSDQVSRALGYGLDEKQIGSAISSQALRDSMLGDVTLSQLTQPGIQLQDIDSLMRRQQAGYERDLLSQMLDYDLGTEELATTLRQQGLSSLLDFLASGQYGDDPNSFGLKDILDAL